MVEIVGALARKRPNQIAVDDGNLQLTYAQVYAMVCRLSHEIARADLPPGAIGIMVRYDAMHLVSVLGCLAAGRPSLLLNPDSPPAYNAGIIEAAKLRAVIVNGGDAGGAVEPDRLPIIAVESALILGDADGSPAARLGAEEPAFIVSTSGTTGTPKLVVSTQRRIHLRMCDAIEAGRFQDNDRFLTLGSSITGATLSRNLVPLLIGASLQMVDVTRVGLGEALRAIRSGRVTVLRTTVSIMKSLAQLPNASAALTSLRLVWITGEAFLQKDLGRIRQVLPQTCRLAYALSMTETLVTRWHLPEKDDHDPVLVASGYLLPDIEALVLGEDGQPCAAGEVGELVIRSEVVASGEWVDGQMVAGRFVSAPGQSRHRIFRTGDLVRICPDGVFVVHGRKDRMIKVRGHRVEPTVIEATIRGVDGVVDAVIIASPMDTGCRLHGFVVPVGTDAPPGNGDDLAALILEELKTALPAYMRPHDIRIVDTLPINTSGKVDRAALLQRLLADEAAVAVTDFVAVNTASHQSRRWVADAWRAAFGTDKNPALGFDAAGGDSLQFMQIAFRLEQLSGMSLPIDVFDLTMRQDEMALRLDRYRQVGVVAQPLRQQIFLFPGIGGDEPRLLRFRAACAPDIAFTCLDYGDWTHWVEQKLDLEAIVARMVARIQELAPAGRLSLAGYSLGGRIALVAAAQLQAAGREIGNLFIFDSPAVVPIDPAGAEAARLAPPVPFREEYWDLRRAQSWRAKSFVIALIVARRLAKPQWAPVLRWIARYRRALLPGQLDFYLSFQLREQMLLNFADDWRRSLTIVPRISAPIMIFKAQQRDDRPARDPAAWQRHSPDVTVIAVGGNHFTMFDPPHLADICAKFLACEARADDAQPEQGTTAS